MANYPLNNPVAKDVVFKVLKYLGGGAALAGGAELLKIKKDLEKANKAKAIITNEYIDSKNRELALDKALRAARLRDGIRTRAFGVIGGGTLGGLGGYGLTSLMTKNKWLKALGGLAGGAAGALGGDYLAYKDYTKHASQNNSNSKFVNNVYNPYKTQNDLLRALGALAGGAAGAGVNYAYNRGNLDGVLSNGMDKLKANKFIKSITSNPKVQSAINYFKQEN